MFKQSVNPAAMQKAQTALDQMTNEFEQKTFESDDFDGVVVVLNGKREMVDLKTELSAVPPGSVKAAYQDAFGKLELERNLRLVRIRNEILSKTKCDIKAISPDVASALLYMENRKRG